MQGMSSAILTIVIVMLFVGAYVGAAYARMTRQWQDYRKTKAALPGMRKGAWLLTRLFGSRFGIIAFIVISLLIYTWAVGGE